MTVICPIERIDIKYKFNKGMKLKNDIFLVARVNRDFFFIKYIENTGIP